MHVNLKSYKEILLRKNFLVSDSTTKEFLFSNYIDKHCSSELLFMQSFCERRAKRVAFDNKLIIYSCKPATLIKRGQFFTFLWSAVPNGKL